MVYHPLTPETKLDQLISFLSACWKTPAPEHWEFSNPNWGEFYAEIVLAGNHKKLENPRKIKTRNVQELALAYRTASQPEKPDEIMLRRAA